MEFGGAGSLTSVRKGVRGLHGAGPDEYVRAEVRGLVKDLAEVYVKADGQADAANPLQVHGHDAVIGRVDLLLAGAWAERVRGPEDGEQLGVAPDDGAVAGDDDGA